MVKKLDWPVIWELTWAMMKARYRKTWAGVIWVILNPLMIYGVQSIAFKYILKINVPDYSLFLLGGLLPWIFLIQSMNMTATKLYRESGILKSYDIHPLTLVFSQVLDNFFNFMLAFLLLLGILFIGGPTSGAEILFLPLALLILVLGCLGLCIFLSVSQVFFYDTQYIIPFFTSVVFFITPVFFPISYVPQAFQSLVELNPLYILILPVRACIYSADYNLFIVFLKAGLLSIFLLIGAMYYWASKRNMFYARI